MRKLVRVCLVVGVLAAAGRVAQAVTCSCTASDHSCSASITCSLGCFATCGSGGSCSAGCTSGGDGGIDYQSYSIVNGGGMNATQVSQTLSELLQRPAVYVAGKPEEVLTFDFQQAPASEIVRALGKRGAVALASPDRTRFSLRAEKAAAGTIAEAVQAISGGRFELTPRDAQQQMTLDVKRVPLADLQRILAGLGEGRVVEP